jgi:D-alanyl-D-alanine endopeptidase (penicillin-binding protein 7)
LILRAFFQSNTLRLPGVEGTDVVVADKFSGVKWGRWVTAGLSALVAVVALTAPVTASAVTKKRVAAKAHAAHPAKRVVSRVVLRNGRRVVIHQPVAAVHFEPAKPSFGQLAGLHEVSDSLELKSSVALVLDQDTNEVLFSKNSKAVLPIASLTKLMTALVVTEAALPANEILTVSDEDIDTEKGSRSRLRVGTQLARGEMLHLALMASENRAANALGRNFPGGISAFVAAMNRKALQLGMSDTHYVEPTGLSSQNQSSARDLATLVKAAYSHPIIRELSTSPEYSVEVGARQVQFHNTNRLVTNPEWNIGLQKTGYIAEAGRCLVMQAKLAGRQLIMVFLDSAGKYSRLGDAERVRHWLTTNRASAAVVAPVVAVPKLTS